MNQQDWLATAAHLTQNYIMNVCQLEFEFKKPGSNQMTSGSLRHSWLLLEKKSTSLEIVLNSLSFHIRTRPSVMAGISKNIKYW